MAVIMEANMGRMTRDPMHLSRKYLVGRLNHVALRQIAELPASERQREMYQVRY